MMKKIIHDTLRFLAAAQIAFAILYAFAGMFCLQPFSETQHLLALSEAWQGDQYTGILYPLLLAICRLAEGITTIPFCAFIYLIQMGCAGAVCVYLVKTFAGSGSTGGESLDRLLAGLALACVPQYMQMHMAVLEWSLFATAILWMFASVLRWKDGDPFAEKTVVQKTFLHNSYRMFLPFLALCLLRAEGIFFGTALLALWGIRVRKVYRKRFLVLVMAVCIFVGVGGNTLTTKRDGKQIQNTVSSALLSRLVWPNFATNYFFWNEEVKAVMDLDRAVYVCEREDAMRTWFGPEMEARYGLSEANRMYFDMALQCLGDRSREEVTFLAQDAADYALLPFTVQRNLAGSGNSMTGWNYGRMLRPVKGDVLQPILTPGEAASEENFGRLVKFYVQYGFVFLLILLVAAIFGMRPGFGHLREKKGRAAATLALVSLFHLVMSGNMPVDYKSGLIMILLWYLTAILLAMGLWNCESKHDAQCEPQNDSK